VKERKIKSFKFNITRYENYTANCTLATFTQALPLLRINTNNILLGPYYVPTSTNESSFTLPQSFADLYLIPVNLNSHECTWPEVFSLSFNGYNVSKDRCKGPLKLSLKLGLVGGVNKVVFYKQSAIPFAYVIAQATTLTLQELANEVVESKPDIKISMERFRKKLSTFELPYRIELAKVSNINFPVNGKLCTHIEPIDLYEFLERAEDNDWKCPHCKQKCTELIVDSYFEAILRKLRAKNVSIESMYVNTKGRFVVNENIEVLFYQGRIYLLEEELDWSRSSLEVFKVSKIHHNKSQKIFQLHHYPQCTNKVQQLLTKIFNISKYKTVFEVIRTSIIPSRRPARQLYIESKSSLANVFTIEKMRPDDLVDKEIECKEEVKENFKLLQEDMNEIKLNTQQLPKGNTDPLCNTTRQQVTKKSVENWSSFEELKTKLVGVKRKHRQEDFIQCKKVKTETESYYNLKKLHLQENTKQNDYEDWIAVKDNKVSTDKKPKKVFDIVLCLQSGL